MSETHHESFAELYRRLKAGIPLVSGEQEQEKAARDAQAEFMKGQQERKYKVFYDNLDLVLRHKDEILANPRYANIDAHYLIGGGGCWVGSLPTVRRLNFAGTTVSISLKLGTLLQAWEESQFCVECECGAVAVVRHFVGSPLSGGCYATAFCPSCKKEIHGIGDRRFGSFFWFLQTKFAEDIGKFAKDFVARWTLAESENEKRVAAGNFRDPRPGACFRGDCAPCDIESLIHDLRLKEFRETGRTH